MKTITIVLLLVLAFLSAKAQTAPPISRNPVMDEQFFTIREWISPKEKNTKTIYLFDSWNNGTIYMKNKQIIKGYKLNYDLENDVIEIETKDGIKLLPSNRVKSFTLENSDKKDSTTYLNGEDYKMGNIYNIGFYEVLSTGPKLQLFKKTDLEIMRANYNAITNTGYKTDKITKKEKVYIAEGNKVIQVKGNDFGIFGRKAKTVEAYAKANKLKLKNAEDAAQIVAYFNSF